MGRRANGEGSVYRDKANELWYGAITVNGRQRKTRGFKKRDEAVKALLDLRRELDAGVDITARQLTVKDLFEEYLETLIKPVRAPKTYRSYRQLADCYILADLGDVKLKELRTPRVQRLLNKLNETGGEAGDGLAENTVSRVRTLVIQALNVAIEWDLIVKNVALKTKLPESKKPPREKRPLTEEEASKLLKAAVGHRHYPIYRLALSTGAREAELLAVLHNEFDPEAGTIRISGQIQRNGGKLVRRPYVKNKQPRTVALPAEVVQALREHLERIDAERELLGDEWKDHGLVFPSQVGTPIEPRNLVRHFKSLLVKAGLPTDIHFHDLRHSAATIMLNEKVPIQDVSATLGHSSIRVTGDIYAHPDDARILDATSAADEAVRRGTRRKKPE